MANICSPWFSHNIEVFAIQCKIFCNFHSFSKQFFTGFFLQVEDGKDYLNIYDGGSDDSELVESLTGELESLTVELDYGKISVQGNQLFVVFSTNNENVREGFQALIIESEYLSDIRNCIISLNGFISIS